jgi:FdhD protein
VPSRQLAEEVPVAFSVGGSAHAVMMATPDDLEDFAVGFALAEGIVSGLEEITAIEIVEVPRGIDVQISLEESRAAEFTARRRAMAGPVGCGLCGVETIEEALPATEPVRRPDFRLKADEVSAAMAKMSDNQTLFHSTRATHAAAFYRPGGGVEIVREDVGRHNALDKLCGALARTGVRGREGVVLLTSRVSVELVQKTARAGSAYMVAVSAPTALAVEEARDAGICLIGVARGDGFEVFTYPEMVEMQA